MAQLVEHGAYNTRVEGLIPTGGYRYEKIRTHYRSGEERLLKEYMSILPVPRGAVGLKGDLLTD